MDGYANNTGISFAARASLTLTLLLALVLAMAQFACSPASDNGKGGSADKTSKRSRGYDGTRRVVENLIKNKGNPDQRYNAKMKKDDGGLLILLWAVSHGDAESAKLLLDAGANPDIPLMKGSSETPLFEVPRGTVLETDRDGKASKRAEDAKICGMLIEAGADVNHTNKLGETPLIKAARKGREDICAALVEGGADIDHTDRIGNTALHAAAKAGYWKVAALLLEKGAKPDVKNRMGDTPLSLAEKRADEKLHGKCRKALPEAYADADYDKTIDALKKR